MKNKFEYILYFNRNFKHEYSTPIILFKVNDKFI